MMSLVVPVYKNEGSLVALVAALGAVQQRLGTPLEVVFVVDGSPDQSHPRLRELLRSQPFSSQLLLLSRNFGSFAAIRAGLEHGRGDYFAVLAADRVRRVPGGFELLGRWPGASPRGCSIAVDEILGASALS